MPVRQLLLEHAVAVEPRLPATAARHTTAVVAGPTAIIAALVGARLPLPFAFAVNPIPAGPLFFSVPSVPVCILLCIIIRPPLVAVVGITRLPPTATASPLPSLTRHHGGERELYASAPGELEPRWLRSKNKIQHRI